MNFSTIVASSPKKSRVWTVRSSSAFLLFGIILAIVSATLLVSGQWQLAFGIVFILPAAVLFIKYPFIPILVWLLLDPFLFSVTTSSGRMVYWMVHRALPPLAVGILGITYLLRIRKFPKLGLADLAMLGYIGVSLFSIALLNDTPLPTAFIFYDRIFSPMCIYFVVRLSAPDEKDMNLLVPVVLFLGVFQALIGILSWIAPQSLPEIWLRLEGERTTGTLVGYSVYSTTMIFVSLFLLHAAFSRKPGIIRAILFCVFFLSVFCVFISYSRASWLAGIIVLLGVFYLHPKFVLGSTLVLIPITIVFISVIFAGYFYDPSERLFESRPALSRLPTELAAYRMFEMKPFLGWGYGNFDYYDRPFQSRVGDLVDARRDTGLHNLYLLISAEQGIVGLILFLSPAVLWLFETIRMRHSLPASGFWNRNLLFLLWLVIIDHFIENNFSVMWIGFGYGMWWLTLGLIANMIPKNTANARSGWEYPANNLK